MKLYVVSDLHLEFAPFKPPMSAVAAADVVILAGDIHVGTSALAWARSSFGSKPIIYLAGNHEYYGYHWTLLLEELRAKAALLDIHFLENAAVEVGGARFLGCTLWTDFCFLPDTPQASSMRRVERGLNDYARIAAPDMVDGTGAATMMLGADGRRRRRPSDPRQLLRAWHTLARHKESLSWLEAQFQTGGGQKVVVVTHHCPSARSVAERYRDDELTPAFASHLDPLVVASDLWIHGHTHDSFDYQMRRPDGRLSRVVCNPRGYPTFGRAFENRKFQPGLLIDLDEAG